MESMTFRELTDQMVALYGQGKFEDALYLTEQHLDVFPEQSARTMFWRMCLLSLTGRSDDVLSLFQQGLDYGLWWAEEIFADPDLNAVRELPEFKRLVTESHKRYEEARTQVVRDWTILLPATPKTDRVPLLLALHGRNGNKESNLDDLEVVRQKGWLVLVAQSTQPLFPGSYCWDDPAQSLADVRFYHKHALQQYPIDPQQVVVAGISQGSGMAIHTALSGRMDISGFIAVASWWADPQSLVPQAKKAKRIRGYFIVGQKDHTLDTTREIQKVLRENQIQFGEEVHPDLAHEFPSDLEKSFDAAIDFIFKERE
jgi:predicted esterase